MEWIDSHIWLIPLMPLLGSLANMFFGKKLGHKAGGVVSCLVVFISLCLSVWAFFRLMGMEGEGERREFLNVFLPWIHVGGFKAEWAFRLDPLSAVMILVVSGVGFLIHVYSTGYMHGDKRYNRFFAFLNLFTFAMLVLVLASNVFLMFIGWEGVGLCSYLLIGFWFEELNNAKAGLKAFVVNRVGDFSFLVGTLLLFWSVGLQTGVWSVDFYELNESAKLLPTAITTVVAILLFGGATGKSAQLPLYVWLPDAMAGPTPVSALIHAATMVTAGVYMIARFSGLYLTAPVAMDIVATVGVLTAIFSASIAFAQNDIKKVLAYSTVSQLGYMFLGVGVGAFAAGIFHLMTHAFFKGLLFLGAGSVIHGLHNQQDMRKMGGLKKYMPWTWFTFMTAWLAISGIPPFSGFFSKDEILWKTFESGHKVLWAIGALAAGMTAFYMTRLMVLTFYGEKRWKEGVHAHESPKNMTIPLALLAVLSLIGGFVGVPTILHGGNHFEHWIAPAVEWLKGDSGGHEAAETGHAVHSLVSAEGALMGLSVLIATAGISIGWWMYSKRRDIPRSFTERYPRLYQAVLNKYYVDEFYNWLVLQNLLRITRACRWFDNNIVDGMVNGAGQLTIIVTRISGWIDNNFVDGTVNAVAEIVEGVGDRLRIIQNGKVQEYLTLAAGVVVLVAAVWIITGLLK